MTWRIIGPTKGLSNTMLIKLKTLFIYFWIGPTPPISTVSCFTSYCPLVSWTRTAWTKSQHLINSQAIKHSSGSNNHSSTRHNIKIRPKHDLCSILDITSDGVDDEHGLPPDIIVLTNKPFVRLPQIGSAWILRVRLHLHVRQVCPVPGLPRLIVLQCRIDQWRWSGGRSGGPWGGLRRRPSGRRRWALARRFLVGLGTRRRHVRQSDKAKEMCEWLLIAVWLIAAAYSPMNVQQTCIVRGSMVTCAYVINVLILPSKMFLLTIIQYTQLQACKLLPPRRRWTSQNMLFYLAHQDLTVQLYCYHDIPWRMLIPQFWIPHWKFVRPKLEWPLHKVGLLQSIRKECR